MTWAKVKDFIGNYYLVAFGVEMFPNLMSDSIMNLQNSQSRIRIWVILPSC